MSPLTARLLPGLLLTAIAAAVVYLLVGPANAGVYHDPLAVAGLGLIGLGLCKSQRQRVTAGPPGGCD